MAEAAVDVVLFEFTLSILDGAALFCAGPALTPVERGVIAVRPGDAEAADAADADAADIEPLLAESGTDPLASAAARVAICCATVSEIASETGS